MVERALHQAAWRHKEVVAKVTTGIRAHEINHETGAWALAQAMPGILEARTEGAVDPLAPQLRPGVHLVTPPPSQLGTEITSAAEIRERYDARGAADRIRDVGAAIFRLPTGVRTTFRTFSEGAEQVDRHTRVRQLNWLKDETNQWTSVVIAQTAPEDPERVADSREYDYHIYLPDIGIEKRLKPAVGYNVDKTLASSQPLAESDDNEVDLQGSLQTFEVIRNAITRRRIPDMWMPPITQRGSVLRLMPALPPEEPAVLVKIPEPHYAMAS